MSVDLHNFLPYRLSRVSEALSQEIRPIYKDMYGLNRPEWRVLAALADLGPCTATEVGLHSAQHKTKVSRAVYALEQRRWLRRAVAEGDRRSEILTMTPAGMRAYGALIEPLQARSSAVVDKLTAADRAALLRGLDALEAALRLRSDRAVR